MFRRFPLRSCQDWLTSAEGSVFHFIFKGAARVIVAVRANTAFHVIQANDTLCPP